MQKILIVDDDPHIRDVLRFALEKDGYEVTEAENGVEALKCYASEQPDLLVLDIMMPEMDGTEVCRQLRRGSVTPIVFLSAKDDEVDRILGLELGGDDYMTKPFSPRELVARVRAVLRRGQLIAEAAKNQRKNSQSQSNQIQGSQSQIWQVGTLKLDQDQFQAWYNEAEIILTVTEFGILRTLLQQPGRVFRREELMNQAYELNTVVSDRTIDSHVRRLRSKLKACGDDPIATVHGIGYKISAG